MIEIVYAPSFLKQLKKLDVPLAHEAEEKIARFKDLKNHKSLHVHKLKGPLDGFLSFSVNYRFRIVFKWLSKREAALLQIGDHATYD